MDENELGSMLSGSMLSMFRGALEMLEDDPGLAEMGSKVLANQLAAAERRDELREEGLHVPPFMIMSVTSSCNLNCSGCYAKKLHSEKGPDMSPLLIGRVLEEASDLGISIVLLAGGEPLIRSDLLDIAASCENVLFPLFTNGMLLDKDRVSRIKEAGNIIPVVSIEGHSDDTDNRRGVGTSEGVDRAFSLLRENGVFFGVSITLTRDNFELVFSEDFIDSVLEMGAGLFIFVEYVPVDEDTQEMDLLPVQVSSIPGRTDELGERYPAIFIAFPGDESKFGGCLSSGRGFVHIGSNGDLEPCPFAPYSDVSLKEISLREALASPLLKEIRANHSMLAEVKGGCALWEHRDWVSSLSKR